MKENNIRKVLFKTLDIKIDNHEVLTKKLFKKINDIIDVKFDTEGFYNHTLNINISGMNYLYKEIIKFFLDQTKLSFPKINDVKLYRLFFDKDIDKYKEFKKKIQYSYNLGRYDSEFNNYYIRTYANKFFMKLIDMMCIEVIFSNYKRVFFLYFDMYENKLKFKEFKDEVITDIKANSHRKLFNSRYLLSDKNISVKEYFNEICLINNLKENYGIIYECEEISYNKEEKNEELKKFKEIKTNIFYYDIINIVEDYTNEFYTKFKTHFSYKDIIRVLCRMYMRLIRPLNIIDHKKVKDFNFYTLYTLQNEYNKNDFFDRDETIEKNNFKNNFTSMILSFYKNIIEVIYEDKKEYFMIINLEGTVYVIPFNNSTIEFIFNKDHHYEKIKLPSFSFNDINYNLEQYINSIVLLNGLDFNSNYNVILKKQFDLKEAKKILENIPFIK